MELISRELVLALIEEEAPIIEERPTGKWLSNSHGIQVRCSNCGATPITEIRENKANASLGINWVANQKFSEVFKYCPICGAEMRGEEQ